MTKEPGSIGLNKAAAALAAACAAAFAPSLRARQFFQDDWSMVGGNPLLHQGWRGALRLPLIGYWEAVVGGGARVQEYRPLLMESFLAQTWLHSSLAGLHAANLLIHFAACLLLFVALSRRMNGRAALIGALLFAVLPVHAEAVCLLTGRSELLCAVFLLAAWLNLEPGRRPKTAFGLAFYAAALLTKESAVLFPLILALGDWTLRGPAPWRGERLKLQARLWALSTAYMALRLSVLGRDFTEATAISTRA